MALSDVLNGGSVSVSSEAEGLVRDKQAALRRLAELLAGRTEAVERDAILSVLEEREAVQSTGVGGGVAVPHGAVPGLDRQIAALLVCPDGIAFEAIDDAPVHIFFALVGPVGAPAQHLKMLASVSRVLRHASARERLRGATSGDEAFALLMEAESKRA